MKHKVVVSLFDKTGTAVQSWADAGYQCVLFDTQHPNGFTPLRENITAVNCDLSIAQPTTIRDLVASAIRARHFDHIEIAFVFAFVPCTHLAVSGARWFKGKGLRALASSINLFATAADYCEYTGAPYLIENPVSTIAPTGASPTTRFTRGSIAAMSRTIATQKRLVCGLVAGFVCLNRIAIQIANLMTAYIKHHHRRSAPIFAALPRADLPALYSPQTHQSNPSNWGKYENVYRHNQRSNCHHYAHSTHLCSAGGQRTSAVFYPRPGNAIQPPAYNKCANLNRGGGNGATV